MTAQDQSTAPATPDLCDAYPDAVRVLEPMMVNFGGIDAFGGPAVTVKCFEDNSVVKELAATKGEGRVMVVDGGGSMRRALLGDQVAAQAADNGWAGLVLYGCVRDVDALATTVLGIQAIGAVPVKTEKRGLGDRDVPVTFGGVTFHPGDWVYADNNGVIVADRELTLPAT
jgi:regulator of ribonuclease activity A